MIEGIKTSELSTEKNTAYYCLLRTQALHRLGKPVPSDSMIDRSVKFYEHSGDHDKVARAYFYKGELLFKRNEMAQGVAFTKKAEKNVDKDNYVLRHHIYESLAFNSEVSCDYEKSIYYCKKALACAEKAGNKNWMLFDLNLTAYNFENIGQTDSVSHYIRKSVQFINAADKENRSWYFCNIGLLYIDSFPKIAARYLNTAIKMDSDAYTCGCVAYMYYKTSNMDKAERLFMKAAGAKKANTRMQALEMLMTIKKEKGLYKEANELSEQLIALKDSVRQADGKRSLKIMQISYANKEKTEKYTSKMRTAVCFMAVLALIALSVVLYSRIKNRRIKLCLDADREEIKRYNNRITELEKHMEQEKKTVSEQEREIKKLKKDVSKIEERHSSLLANGHKRYQNIVSGKTTVSWTKDDFRNFVEYYKIIEPQYVSRLITQHTKMTNKAVTYAILSHLGIADKDIAHIMCVSESSVRSARHRMNESI